LITPKPFRVIKNEIRVLGVDDGKFVPHTKETATVIGVIFRGSLSVEGVMHTHVLIDGLDSTDRLTQMINCSSHHRQLRLVMLNGITLAGFNLVDINKLFKATNLPIIAITPNKPDLDSIYSALKHLPDAEERWRLVLKAGKIHEVSNHGTQIYVEMAGISLEDAKKIIVKTSTRSCLPEPLRVAHLIASGISP
jgi:endonuclease V-like protein UPF0215 family